MGDWFFYLFVLLLFLSLWFHMRGTMVVRYQRTLSGEIAVEEFQRSWGGQCIREGNATFIGTIGFVASV